jgi:hypothetical protein
MINNPSCSISNQEWREEEAHGFQTASRTKQDITEDQPRLQDRSNQHTSSHALRGDGKKKVGSQTWGRWTKMHPPRHTLRPKAQALDRGHHRHGISPQFICCIALTPDGLDGVFKKITMPWRRHRLFRRPDLGFLPVTERR